MSSAGEEKGEPRGYQRDRSGPSPSRRRHYAPWRVAPDDRLQTTDLLAAMPPEVRERLLAHATRRTFQRNEFVFDQGDRSYALYVIDHGRVAIAARPAHGKESGLALLAGGGLFGELAVVR